MTDSDDSFVSFPSGIVWGAGVMLLLVMIISTKSGCAPIYLQARDACNKAGHQSGWYDAKALRFRCVDFVEATK